MPPAQPTIALIILAAGKARRLGRDKPTLPWGTKTLVRHVVDAFPPDLYTPRIVVTNPENTTATTRLLPSSVRITTNPNPSGDMLSSVRVGEHAVTDPDSALCIHPVDVFAVTTKLAQTLHNAWIHDPRAIHIPTVGNRRAHPLILPAHLRPELDSIPQGQGLNLLTRNESGRVRTHPWNDPQLLCDVDTLRDYERYRPTS